MIKKQRRGKGRYKLCETQQSWESWTLLKLSWTLKLLDSKLLARSFLFEQPYANSSLKCTLVTFSLLKESSVVEEPNSHGELDQPQVWNDVNDGSMGNFQQDITMNINSEVS